VYTHINETAETPIAS